MTKKDYIKIAATLKTEKPYEQDTHTEWGKGTKDEWCTVVLRFARMLQDDNPQFDRSRFLTACGYND